MSITDNLKRTLGFPPAKATGHGAQHRGQGDQASHEGHGGRGHGLMMIACCVPMIVIAIVLVATGVAGTGFIFSALACTVMMALMMGGHGHSGGGGKDGRS